MVVEVANRLPSFSASARVAAAAAKLTLGGPVLCLEFDPVRPMPPLSSACFARFYLVSFG
jgi:hypothetical protein